MGFSEENLLRLDHETQYLNIHPEDLENLKQKIGCLLQSGGAMEDTYRLWNDKRQEYHWIRLDGTLQVDEDGWKLFYGVYRDVSEQEELKKELTIANEKMEDITNAIPGGVAI